MKILKLSIHKLLIRGQHLEILQKFIMMFKLYVKVNFFEFGDCFYCPFPLSLDRMFVHVKRKVALYKYIVEAQVLDSVFHKVSGIHRIC